MKSKIEWTDDTWNPVRGCSFAKGSELGGCLHCYAAAMAARNLPEMRSPTTGEPFAIFKDSGPRWTGKVELIESKLMEPLHWRKPRRVFVNSMSDLFHEGLPDADILSVLRTIGMSPRHTFQVLTKRSGRMLDLLKNRHWRNLGHSPAMGGDHYVPIILGEHRGTDSRFLPNLHLGVSVENQPTADERIPLLLQTPAAVHFASYEPALGAVKFTPYLGANTYLCNCGWHDTEMDLQPFGADRMCLKCLKIARSFPGLDWIIAGGESGPGARPFDIEWARSTVRQCKAAGVPVFVKQLGALPITTGLLGKTLDGKFVVGSCAGINGNAVSVLLDDRKGGDWSEWPEDLRVRQFPGQAAVASTECAR